MTETSGWYRIGTAPEWAEPTPTTGDAVPPTHEQIAAAIERWETALSEIANEMAWFRERVNKRNEG